jgi:hypothetical protein
MRTNPLFIPLANMLTLFIRLDAQHTVEYQCHGARNGLARVLTHEKRIQDLVLKHHQTFPTIFSVVLCPEDRQKEEQAEHDLYYKDGMILSAHLVPVVEREDAF